MPQRDRGTISEEQVKKELEEADLASKWASVRQATADARKAEIEAGAAQRAAEDYDPVQARAEQAAKSRKAVAEADLEASKARREQLSAFLPDLSKVDQGSLTVADGGPAIGATALTFAAVANAAEAVARQVVDRLTKFADGGASTCRVLVTSEVDLATTDSLYTDVKSGLDELIGAVDALLHPPQKPVPRGVDADFLVGDAAQAVAAAVPAVLSIMSAKRTLATATITPTDTAAAGAVLGALASSSITVAHDSFRTVIDGNIYGGVRQLDSARNQLRVKQVEQAELIRTLSAAVGDRAAAVARFTEEIAKAEKAGLDCTHLKDQLAAEGNAAEDTKRTLAAATDLKATMDAVGTAADGFITTVRAPGAGGGRSLLANAALREQLHDPDDDPNRFTHLLMVRSEIGQTEQAITDRPLWFQDRFSTVAAASITYMLLETAGSLIVGAGTVTGTAAAHGKIGEVHQLS